MPDVMEYLMDNKIIILLVIVFCFLIYFYRNKNVENMTTTTHPAVKAEHTIIPTSGPASNIPTGTNVYLQCTDTTGTYYLGFISTASCKTAKGNCKTNNVVLYKTKNSALILNSLIGQANTYFITGKVNNTSVQLTNSLNIKTKPTNNLCFEASQDQTITSFNITPSTSKTGYLIWVNKKVLNHNGTTTSLPYYVSKHVNGVLCDNLPKLYLHNDISNALLFNFEPASGIIPIATTAHSTPKATPTHHIATKGITSQEIEKFENMSKFSFLDTQTYCDTMSLPGQDITEYASWHGDSNSTI